MKNHKNNCICPFCKSKRDETFGINNSFYGKHHNENIEQIKKDLLFKLYHIDNKTMKQIAIFYDVSVRSIGRKFKEFNIPKKLKSKYLLPNWNKPKTIEIKKKISKSKLENPTKYWLGKSNKDIIIQHHIDGNKNNNDKENLLDIPQGIHMGLHFRGYEFLVYLKLEKEYLKNFIIKYDINILSNDEKLVHHVDCNRYNNNQNNLIYLEDRRIHNKLHQEAYMYLVKINKINDYLKWFFSEERKKSQIVINHRRI